MKSVAICRPNFFIVGAPKSGTTSLYRYLTQHPDVFMSVPKEPCFLAPDFKSPNYPQTEAEYLRCFEGYQGEFRIGEATTTYLYSKLAAREIRRYSPDAKVIAMLRNPIEMVASLHSQRIKEGNENIGRLKEALEAESDRRKGERLPKNFQYPKEYLLYRDFGMYAKQLKRYFFEFGRDNVHVIIFDDFIGDTKKEFDKVCEFLNIPNDFNVDFTIENPGHTPRILLFHRAFIKCRSIFFSIKWQVEKFVSARYLEYLKSLYRLIVRLNKKTGRAPIHIATMANLVSYYEDEIEDIEILLNRKLDCWRTLK